MTEQPVTRIAILLYPDVTSLDFIGPHQILAAIGNTRVDLVAKTLAPVVSDRGISINPDKTFRDGTDYDLLLVPGGGPKFADNLEDEETIAFVRSVGEKAQFVTSVCTGSHFLAAAGLLTGYQATSHWAFKDSMEYFGVVSTKGRVVIDRNRITGGGMTAGIDFGLQLAAILRGEEVAKLMQLVFEYDPAPPYDTGSPERADAETMQRAFTRLGAAQQRLHDISKRVAARTASAAASE